MGRHRKQVDPHLLFRVCEMFLRADHEGRRTGVADVADWLRKQNVPCSREQVYELLNQGLKAGYLRLCPPPEIDLPEKMASAFNFTEAQMEVVDVIGPSIEEHLAQVAAERILARIRELAETRQEVHIGFGAGMTTYQVAGALARVLRFEANLPQLTIHALSSGFSVVRPQTAPVAFFSFFGGINPPVNFVGLFAPAVVNVDEYETIKQLPGVKQSFEAAKAVDIVVTSLAKKDDPHGQLNRFMRDAPGGSLAALEEAGVVGDIQWRPYSDTGPIQIHSAIRAVTIYELSDLLKLAATQDKTVLVVCGRCNVCREDKARALLPLLREPSLRVFNHLVTDRDTAAKVLEIANQNPLPDKG